MSRAVDNTAARAAVEGAAARIEQMSRTLPSLPPNIPGMPRH